MLKVDRKHIAKIEDAILLLGARSVEKTVTEKALDVLREALHTAMKLEASTIPPYLVAAWSIKPSPQYQNEEIKKLIMSVAKEEMLHMMTIANIISATGTVPNIATPEIVLNWGEDELPVGGNLIPVLAPFSMDILQHLFMEIEKPKNPIHYVVKTRGEVKIEPHFGTIGEFYDALILLINSFKEDPFLNGAKYPQIRMYPRPGDDARLDTIEHAPMDNFQVTNKTLAIKLLNWIIDQGEGTSDGPLDGGGEPAHYYRFAEIFNGGKLMKDDKEPLGYVYNRAEYPIDCDFSAVYDFVPNPKMADFPKDSTQYKGQTAFNQSYTSMFKELQDFYSNSDKSQVTLSIITMGTMANFANRLLSLTPCSCPSFEWIEEEQQPLA